MDFIFPRSRSTIFRTFNEEMEPENVPILENIHMVHDDEQHPKEGSCHNSRLTLLDAKAQRTIADELLEDKSPETIKNISTKKSIVKRLNNATIMAYKDDFYCSNYRHNYRYSRTCVYCYEF